jgi:hypothetical protein
VVVAFSVAAGIKNACDRLLTEKISFASMALETDAYVAWLGAHHGGDSAIGRRFSAQAV